MLVPKQSHLLHIAVHEAVYNAFPAQMQIIPVDLEIIAAVLSIFNKGIHRVHEFNNAMQNFK